jgi:hypothetical protein
MKGEGAAFGSAAAAEERYRRRYIPGQRIYFRLVRPWQHADVVVENTDATSPEVNNGTDVLVLRARPRYSEVQPSQPSAAGPMEGRGGYLNLNLHRAPDGADLRWPAWAL